MGEASTEKVVRKLKEEVKEKFVRARRWYVPSFHEKYLRVEEGV